MNSLDPRVNRLPEISSPTTKSPLDQLNTFEVFVQPKEGRPFQHEGAVHAADPELAFVLAKENFTRRFTCHSLWVTDTKYISVSPMTEGTENVYIHICQPQMLSDAKEPYEIFQMTKRGKQHVHARTILASSPEEAMYLSKLEQGADSVVYNVWAMRTKDIRMTHDDERDLWLTLPEKKFRDAAAYKGGDKLKEFLERNK